MDEAEAYFAGHPLALAVFRAVRSMLETEGPVEIRTTRSYVAFRRRRGFAFVWLPGRWIANPAAEVVLSFALTRRDDSPRIKQVVEPTPGVWMHHLEVRALDDLDGEVRDWLGAAFEDAA